MLLFHELREQGIQGMEPADMRTSSHCSEGSHECIWVTCGSNLCSASAILSLSLQCILPIRLALVR